MATKIIELVLYKNIEHDYETTRNVGDLDGSPNYIHLSEPISVEFELLQDGDVVNAEIESIRGAIEATKRECAKSVQAAEEKIQSLLALPNLTEE